jgi:hypothetical protein
VLICLAVVVRLLRHVVQVPVRAPSYRDDGLGALRGAHLVDAGNFHARTGFSAVVCTNRPGLQFLCALCLIITTGQRYIHLAEATAVNVLAPY